jgi:hypothetical protein
MGGDLYLRRHGLHRPQNVFAVSGPIRRSAKAKGWLVIRRAQIR